MDRDASPAAPQPVVDLLRGELRDDATAPISLDSDAWNAWLARAHAFKVIGVNVPFLVIRETRSRGGSYWVGGFVRQDWLAGASYENSPLVKSDYALAAGIGIAYIFARSSRTVEAYD